MVNQQLIMASNRLIPVFFIFLLGIIIPAALHIYRFEIYTFSQIIIVNCYSLTVAYVLWQAFGGAIARARRDIYKNNYGNLLASCLIAVALSSLAAIFLECAYRLFGDHVAISIFVEHVFAISLLLILHLLVSEIVFLLREKEEEHSRTVHLNSELTKAQLTVLKNELDPHFIYNALNTLSWLVKEDPDKADEFILRLSQIYKYFLVNKTKEFVTLGEELHFIKDYFFLLQLRYENKIDLKINISTDDPGTITVLPCALQILVENAIKHNAFSASNPLCIKISVAGDYLYVMNTRAPGKIPPHYSNKVGLRNLKARYELAYKKPIMVDAGKSHFVVRLPLLKTA